MWYWQLWNQTRQQYLHRGDRRSMNRASPFPHSQPFFLDQRSNGCIRWNPCGHCPLEFRWKANLLISGCCFPVLITNTQRHSSIIFYCTARAAGRLSSLLQTPHHSTPRSYKEIFSSCKLLTLKINFWKRAHLWIGNFRFWPLGDVREQKNLVNLWNIGYKIYPEW